MKRLLFIFLLLYLAFSGEAQTDTAKLYLDFPLLDLPYMGDAKNTTGSFFKAYGNPSMKQSLQISNNLYSSVHLGIDKGINLKSKFMTKLLKSAAITSFDLISIYTPLSSNWLHEEYHRAVMTVHGINSFNDINTFPFGQQVISVHEVKDSEMAYLYDHRRTDFTRLAIAGIEGQYHQVQQLQTNNFFYNSDIPMNPLYWITTIMNAMYVRNSTTEYFDDVTDEMRSLEGTDINKRDFIGADFTAWSDALFFPDKTYSQRGTHPSGVGINRYIKPAELAPEAMDYLKKQSTLQLLNFVTPFMIGKKDFTIHTQKHGTFYANFALRHWLTSFGSDITIDLFLKNDKNNWLFTIHNYQNYKNYFIGLETVNYRKHILNNKLSFTTRAMVWTQPEKLSFYASKADVGGLVSVKTNANIGVFSPYIELSAKTAGWVVGEVYQNKSMNVNFGLNLIF